MNDSTTRLYHRNVYWKKWFNTASYRIISTVNDFSIHFYENQHNISIWRVDKILEDIRARKQWYYLFEIATQYEKRREHITKCCIRTHYDEINDITIVFSEDCIVTAWLNKTNDTHTTLNYKKYYKRY